MYSTIKITTIKLPRDAYRYEYELIGKPPYKVSAPRPSEDAIPDLQVGKSFRLGAYRLLVTDYDYLSDSYSVVPDGVTARAGYRLERIRRVFDNIYRRFILTLEVWDLAKVDREGYSYKLPSWRDIKLFKHK